MVPGQGQVTLKIKMSMLDYFVIADQIREFVSVHDIAYRLNVKVLLHETLIADFNYLCSTLGRVH